MRRLITSAYLRSPSSVSLLKPSRNGKSPALNEKQSEWARTACAGLDRKTLQEFTLVLNQCLAASLVRTIVDMYSQYPFGFEQKSLCIQVDLEESTLTKMKIVGRIDMHSESILILKRHWQESLETLDPATRGALTHLFYGTLAAYLERCGIFEVQRISGGAPLKAGERKASDLLSWQDVQFLDHQVLKLHWQPESSTVRAVEADHRRLLDQYGVPTLLFHYLCPQVLQNDILRR